MTPKDYFFRPLVHYYQRQRPIDWVEEFGRQAPLEVEIGFGTGEALIRLAQNHPERNFIGIEQHWPVTYRALQTIEKFNQQQTTPIENVRILDGDARAIFERLFDKTTIARIYSLFPCPWPKKKHTKHRLFAQPFLQLLNNRLVSGGQVDIVTDFHPFQKWILEEARGSGFTVTTRNIEAQFDTKYERKWQAHGQQEFFEITMRKSAHQKIPVKKDVAMKVYKLKNFYPEKFELENCKEKVSVVFKEWLYDTKEKNGCVYVIVAEENLTQHFRVTIKNKNGAWLVKKADGQDFFPTPGVNLAVQLVYEAAQNTAR